MIKAKLIWGTVSVQPSTDILGDCYAMFNLKNPSDFTSSELNIPSTVIAIIPLGATRKEGGGYIGVVAPYAWSGSGLITYAWAITTPTGGEYGVNFACLYT